jgi:hypothetical protein
MGKVISLSKARKGRQRTEEKRQADANAVKHGKTLAERRAEAVERDRAKRELDGKKTE